MPSAASSDLSANPLEIFTIGHGRLESAAFFELLVANRVGCVVDVRTVPYSRFARWTAPHTLAGLAQQVGMDWRWEGAALGGRPFAEELRTKAGKPDYDKIAASAGYQDALRRVLALAAQRRVVLMCAESSPDHCHRESLLGRSLRRQGHRIFHILADGSTPGVAQETLWEAPADYQT